MSLDAVSISFVVAVLVHNTEEAFFLPAWSRRAGRWHRPVTPFEFRFAVAILSALLLGAAILAYIQGPMTVGAYLFAGYAFAMTANAIVPHLVVTVALRSYMPGTLTGLVFNLPLGILVLRGALEEQWVSRPTLLWSAPLVAAVLVAFTPFLFAAGRLVSSARAHPYDGGSVP